MKKIILSLFFAVTTFGFAFSQGNFSAGLDLGLPLGTPFSDFYSVGFGISGRYEAPIQTKLNWTATGGFLSFGGKTVTGFSVKSITMIPIQGGIKYYFQKSNSGIYGDASLGLFFLSGSGSSETKVGFSPGFGYRSGKFDILGRFNVVSDFNYFGIRGAYVF
ncbi:MAG: hypothetical protein ACKVOQ_11060 [Cyclobacteriaceae bacterium]